MSDKISMKVVEHSNVAPGLFALHLDLPGEKVNKLSPTVLREFDQNVEALRTNKAVKVLVILSEKEGIFIAGADIAFIRAIADAKEGEGMARDGQAVLQKLEELPFPVVAAIHGASMGGGTELALCCKYIIVSDAPSTKIALPEVNLGILPGFGGTVRMPRKIGLQASLDYLLTGKTMSGEKAVKLGLAEAVLPAQDFKRRALEWAAPLAKGQKPIFHTRPPGTLQKLQALALENNPAGRAFLLSQARKMVLGKTRGHYPAPLKILDSLSKSFGASKKSALKIEQKSFGELVPTEVSKRLIELFYATEAVKKQTGVTGQKLEKADAVQNLGLLGAGVMGGGIAQLAAEKGIPIRVKDIDHKGLALGMATTRKLFDGLVKKKKTTRREADIKIALISPTTEYTGFQRVDLVIEAVVENMDIKKKVLKETEAHLREDAIFATNTSSLSVTEMATAASRPENVVGMHFFNPVHRMPLIEVIRGEKTSDKAVLKVFELSKRMGKTPVVVKDGPGFLVNRLLMPYMNEASYLMAEGAPILELDEEVLDFGMPMGPATLLDEVGIDVGAKVAKILHHAFGARAEPCPINDKLVEAKLLGKKSGKGFYLYDASGRKTQLNPEIYKVLGVTVVKPSKDQRASWVPRMIFQMINEAAICLDEGIAEDAQTVDLGMIMGTGFPPFRGGLLRYADSLGVVNIVKKLEDFAKIVGPRFTPSPAIQRRASKNIKFYS